MKYNNNSENLNPNEAIQNQVINNISNSNENHNIFIFGNTNENYHETVENHMGSEDTNFETLQILIIGNNINLEETNFNLLDDLNHGNENANEENDLGDFQFPGFN